MTSRGDRTLALLNQQANELHAALVFDPRDQADRQMGFLPERMKMLRRGARKAAHNLNNLTNPAGLMVFGELQPTVVHSEFTDFLDKWHPMLCTALATRTTLRRQQQLQDGDR